MAGFTEGRYKKLVSVRVQTSAVLVSVAVLFTVSFGCKSPAVASETLTLAWDSSSDPSVVGYRLYEGSTSQTYTNVVDVGSNLLATISGLIPGASYFFAVTAYDQTGLESAFSGEISYTVPSSSPLALQNLSIARNAANQAVLSGMGSAGFIYDVYATLDLVSWLLIGTVAADASGAFQFTDQLSFALPSRFYRLGQHTP